VLRIFIAIKYPSPWPGLEPATFGSSGQHTNHYTTKATSHCIIQGKDWALSPYVLSSCGLPLPPTCLLVTVNEGSIYFASTIPKFRSNILPPSSALKMGVVRSSETLVLPTAVTSNLCCWNIHTQQRLPNSKCNALLRNC
jgi:hypothetical protein